MYNFVACVLLLREKLEKDIESECRLSLQYLKFHWPVLVVSGWYVVALQYGK
jgi:hypothetical protein